MFKKFAVTLGLIFCFSSASIAEDNYAVFGYTSFEEDSFNGIDGPEGGGLQFTIGHRLNEVFSIEASYGTLEYDDYQEEIVSIETGAEGLLVLSGDAESLELSVLAQKRLASISPFAILGIMQADSGDATAQLIIPDDAIRETFSGDSFTETYFGAGADIHFEGSSFGLRASYKIIGGDIDTDFLSVGAILNF